MTTEGQICCYLLRSDLRNVLDHHIVPASGCRMLRYALSRTCRALWHQLRDEDFIRFARVVRGDSNTWLAFNLLAADVKERYIRAMCPQVCTQFPVGDAKFWSGFFSNTAEKASIRICITPEYSASDTLSGANFVVRLCQCSACRRSIDGALWYLRWSSPYKELYLVKL